MVASVNTLATNITPLLLTALVERGIWGPRQGYVYARQKLDGRQRLEALLSIGPTLPQELQLEVLATTYPQQPDCRFRGERLLAAAPHVGPHILGAVLAELGAAVGKNRYSDLDWVLGERTWEQRLADKCVASTPRLSSRLLREISELAWLLESSADRLRVAASAFTRLMDRMGYPDQLPLDLLQPAIHETEWRADLLASLICHLSESARCALMAEELDVVRTDVVVWRRAAALAAWSSATTDSQAEDLKEEALAAARSADGPRWRVEGLTGVLARRTSDSGLTPVPWTGGS